MPTDEDTDYPNKKPVPAHGQATLADESKTPYGKAFSFFRNMDVSSSRVVRPRKNVHAWDEKVYANRPQNFINNTPIYRMSDLGKPPGYFGESKLHDSPTKKPSLCERLLDQFDTYCDKSTLHGLRYIGDNNISKFERGFWLLAFISAISMAAYFITSIYDKFNTNPVIVSFSPTLTTVDKIPFPAITICNVNMAMKSAAERINNYGTEVDKRLLWDMCNMNSSFPNETDSTEDTANWPTVRKFIISVNQKCSAMFKACKWAGEIFDCPEYVNSILTDEGYCCSFNRLPSNYSLRDASTDDTKETYPAERVEWNPEDGYPRNAPKDVYPKRVLGAGAHLGLTVVLDADLNQYHCTSTNSLGFKIVLSNPLERPKVSDTGFLISPGDEVRVVIQPIIQESTPGIRNVALDKRQCYFGSERYLQFYKYYSERNCKLECQANYTLKRCGCVPYYLPKNDTTKICDKYSELCSNEAKVIIEKFSAERKACMCLPGCVELNFERAASSVGKISAKINGTVNDEYLKNISHSYFAENMCVIHFYFEKDKFMKQVKSELYGFSEFLSNTGGLLGLFLGFSFLSAVEIFYFIVLRSTCNVYNERKRNKKMQQENSATKLVTFPFVK